MTQQQDRLKYLLNQYANRTASPSEEIELFEIIAGAQHEAQIKRIMLGMIQSAESDTELNKEQWAPVLEKVLSQENSLDRYGPPIHKIPVEVPRNNSKKKPIIKRWAIAAAVLVLFSSAAYMLISSQKDISLPLVKKSAAGNKGTNIIPPGRSQAILTLDDGSAINLDSVKIGELASQGKTKIIKGGNGELQYIARQNTEVAGYNTISIPRGGRYSIVLSDGSRVWLNAASSLKYPTSFKGKSRDVTLTGEGYFEIARNTSMPFRVTVKDMTVQVLGTHFNVNAYTDERSVATTLLEGSVKISNGTQGNGEFQTVMLKPGEQADLVKDGKFKIHNPENVEQVVAWKENKFEFNNDGIASIMRQIARWYDVDVDYRGAIPTRRLTGKFSRDVNLSQLIEMLQYTGMNMRIENKKIIVWDSQPAR